jgi:hypothetical protein
MRPRTASSDHLGKLGREASPCLRSLPPCYTNDQGVPGASGTFARKSTQIRRFSVRASTDKQASTISQSSFPWLASKGLNNFNVKLVSVHARHILVPSFMFWLRALSSTNFTLVAQGSVMLSCRTGWEQDLRLRDRFLQVVSWSYYMYRLCFRLVSVLRQRPIGVCDRHFHRHWCSRRRRETERTET